MVDHYCNVLGLLCNLRSFYNKITPEAVFDRESENKNYNCSHDVSCRFKPLQTCNLLTVIKCYFNNSQ